MTKDILDQYELITAGESLGEQETYTVYGMPVECEGFKPLVFEVSLDATNVNILIPDFNHQPGKFTVHRAICILDSDQANKPIVAIVSGSYMSERSLKSKNGPKSVVIQNPVKSIVNLSLEPSQVILSSYFSRPLENTGAYWPGYALTEHQPKLESGREQILIKKNIESYQISFPQNA